MANEFDARLALADLTAGLVLQRNQARLSFSERCGAFCALYDKTPQSIVARAFGITKTTASLLAGCLPDGLEHRSVGIGFTEETYTEVIEGQPVARTRIVPCDVVANSDPNQRRDPERRPRYQDVAREFIRLGRDEFQRLYYTDDIHVRLMKAKYQAGSEDSRGQNGANPAAAKYSFKYHGAIECNGQYYRIAWVPKGKLEFEGWHYASCQEDGSRFEGASYDWTYFLDGSEARAFRTSSEAYDAIFAINELESPRPKPGRPKYQK